MAYRLNPGEPVHEGIKRVAREELDAGAKRLRGQAGSDRDQNIHEARKSLKKTRSLLRLMRPELGRAAKLENARLRTVARRLSELRDAGVMLEVVSGLKERYAERLPDSTLEAVKEGLLQRKQSVETGAGVEKVMDRAAAALERAAPRADKWRLRADGFLALAPGLERTLRRGKKALSRVRKQPSEVRFHDLRKRVKDHWYHVRLLESFGGGAMERYVKTLRELETALGDEHNLTVLRETIAAEPGLFGGRQRLRAFLKLVAERQQELRQSALLTAERVYGPKPRRFLKLASRSWAAHSGPGPARKPGGAAGIDRTSPEGAATSAA